MFELSTPRLRIIPLPHQQLTLLARSRHLMEQSLYLQPSDMKISLETQNEIDEVLPYWVSFTKKFKDNYAWGTTWEIVLSIENQSIGNIGLSGLPDDNGSVIVGYAIDYKHQRQGYATEALAAVKNWVFQSPQALKMEAYTPIDNIASHKVLQKNGFQYKREAVEDGINCYVWEVERLD